jgi:hypothetical protein
LQQLLHYCLELEVFLIAFITCYFASVKKLHITSFTKRLLFYFASLLQSLQALCLSLDNKTFFTLQLYSFIELSSFFQLNLTFSFSVVPRETGIVLAVIVITACNAGSFTNPFLFMLKSCLKIATFLVLQ